MLFSENSAISPTLAGFSISYNTKTENAGGTTPRNQNDNKITALVSTGINLWFNLLIALAIISIVGLVIFRKKKEEK